MAGTSDGVSSETTSRDAPVALIFDPIRSFDWSYAEEEEILRRRGVRLVVPETPQEASQYLSKADVLMASGTVPVTSEVISHLEKCVGILCYTSGKDGVDEPAAENAGIVVDNVKATTIEVAEHAMALLLASARRIVPFANATARGDWDLSHHPELWSMPRLNGRVLGIVGPGEIGKAVAHRARPFGLTTMATYSRPEKAGEPDLPNVDLVSLFGKSDFVVLTAPLTPETRRMIDAPVLDAAKPGLILVNVARGGLIDEEALAEALASGRIRAAGLDVRDPEPPKGDADLLTSSPGVIQTPHVGGASDLSRKTLHRLAGQKVVAILAAAKRI